jgi:peptide/nickel transport system ATP-binding protein
MMDQYMLEIRDLYVYFRVYEGISRVLDGISLDVRKGERVGLAGETGCGKTVSMKTVMGALKIPPASIPKGEVILDGQNVLKMSAKQILQIKGTKVSMIFQDPMNALNPVFAVGTQLFDVIRFSRRHTSNGGKLSRKEILNRAIAALDEVRLPDPKRILNSYPLELSGGMRQRVLIAMALVNGPSFLIADEPQTALDVTIGAQILDLLSELVRTKGISVLLITHNLGVIQETTERVNIMYAGQVAETAPTALLFENPRHPYSQGLLASVPRLTGGEIAEGIRGMVPDYTAAPSGCRFHPRCDHVMPICSQKKPPLFLVEPDHLVGCWLHVKEGEAE